MSATTNVTDADFDARVLASETPVLVDFWAPWCGPCKALAPTLEALAAEYDGKLRIAKLDVDENAASRERFGIRGIPMLALYKGGAEVARLTGSQSRARLAAFLDLHLSIASTDESSAPAGTTAAFGGDPTLRDTCIDRLSRHMASGTVQPGTTAWDGKSGSAMGCAAAAATPEACAAVLGVPAALVGLVDMLSTFYGTVDAGSAYALEWLKAVPVGADLSALPLEMMALMLEDGVIGQEVGRWPATIALRDAIMAAHRAAPGDAPGNAGWAALRAQAGALGEEVPKPLAELLEGAAYPLLDPDALRTVLPAMSIIHAAVEMRHDNWTSADEARAYASMDAHRARLAAEGGNLQASFEAFRQAEPDLATRFETAARRRGALMREAGQIVGTKLREAM